MIFQDKNIQCSDCGAEFVFSANDQRFFKSRGFHKDPKRCQACRGKRSHEGKQSVAPAAEATQAVETVESVIEIPETKSVEAVVFESFGLLPDIMSGVRLSGYTAATPIQAKAIPPALEGSDLIGLAQTGTGKTAAFVLPMLQKLLSKPRGNLRALIISPTRELAEQTKDCIASLGRRTRIRSITLYGGVGMYPQVKSLRDGVDAVVACPGRLLDHVWQGSIDLSSVDTLVIDEADRMFDMGFLPDIKKIFSCMPQKKQVLLFSATMPDDVRKLVSEYLTDPVTVQIGHVAPASTVSHALYPVSQHLKTPLLMEILRRVDTESVVVFTRTKHRAERVSDQLKRSGFNVTSLQGNLAQGRRQEAIDSFRSGKAKILVATDIAARGIDVLSISHVINYDMPDTADAYTHRIGRTGRIEQTGEAFTFVTSEDAAMVRDVERVLGRKIERRTLEGFNYDKEAPLSERSRDGNRTPGQRRPMGRGNFRRERKPALTR